MSGALWLINERDTRSLDRYEGAPSLYTQRRIEVDTEKGPLEAMTYVMASNEYLGLPSPWYFERIALGYRDWHLPEDALRTALYETKSRLEALGVGRYEPDGRKRLRGVV